MSLRLWWYNRVRRHWNDWKFNRRRHHHPNVMLVRSEIVSDADLEWAEWACEEARKYREENKCRNS